MINFIYSEETASSNMASALREVLKLEKSADFHGMRCHTGRAIRMLGIEGRIVNAEFLDGIVDGVTIFLSRHSSSKNIPAFTVHATGNWTGDAGLGGRPGELSVSSPISMLKVLKSVKASNDTEIQVTYEATHHGPFLSTPCFFVELGGSEEILGSMRHAKIIANAIADSLDKKVEYNRIAFGIGSMHYPEKFTRLALEGKYAFSHIMSKYYVDKISMLESAFKRSEPKADIAVLEWKGLKAADREHILRELNRLGIDYAKV